MYWCDIPGFALHRYDPASLVHEQWTFDTDLGCCAPLLGGGLLLAMRNGLWRFDPRTARRERLADAPYDATQMRFNDGKADPQGRFWAGTIHDRRENRGALYRYVHGALEPMVHDVASSNGLGWSPEARTMYWADTKAHAVYAFDFDADDGSLSNQRLFKQFALKQPDQDLASYAGRPDGAAVDSEGAYWAAMYEGARLLRMAPSGDVLQEVPLPVQCPTMPCFGGADLKTLYVTSARGGRSDDELARQPWAGCVLQMRVTVPGLPVNLVQL